MKLLHIIATPRTFESNTMPIATAYLKALRAHQENVIVETLNLFTTQLPVLMGDNIAAIYNLRSQRPIEQRYKTSWQRIEQLIDQFLSADVLLITTPTWNLSIPYLLKQYIDCIFQPSYLFQLDALGQKTGVVAGKTAVCITTSGGEQINSQSQQQDFLQPYLQAVLESIGIEDVHFICAQITAEQRETAVAQAIKQAQTLAKK